MNDLAIKPSHFFVYCLTFLALSLSFLTIAEGVYGACTEGDSWASKKLMHYARSSLGVAVVDDKIYAIGGTNLRAVGGSEVRDTKYYRGGVVGYNEEYDPKTDEWTTKTAMPTSRSRFAIAAYQNKIYCMGGFDANGTAVAINEVYDTLTDTWETKTPMSAPRTHVQATVVDGKIYLLCGFLNGDLNHAININQAYDPKTDSWATMAAIPNQASAYTPAVAFNNQIYLMGEDIKIYDPQANTWNSAVLEPLTTFYGYAAATSGKFAPARIYVFSGAEVKVFDPANGSWSLGAALPSERQQFGAVSLDDQLYVVGGEYLKWNIGGGLQELSPLALNTQYTPMGYCSPESTPPKVSFDAPLNQTYNTSSVPLTFVADKNITLASYSLDGQQNVTVAGNTTIINVPDGSHNLTVYTTDAYGNVGSQTTTFTVKTPDSLVSTSVIVGVAVAVVAISLIIGALLHRRRQRKRGL